MSRKTSNIALPARPRNWVHIGMPKAGSTSIQAALAMNLPRSHFYDATLALRELKQDPSKIVKALIPYILGLERPSNLAFTGASLHARRSSITLSAEDLCWIKPTEDWGSVFSRGLAIVRPPDSWVVSYSTQLLFSDFPFGDPDLEFAIDHIRDGDPRHIWPLVIENSYQKYHKIIANILEWANIIDTFTICDLAQGLDVNRLLEAELPEFKFRRKGGTEKFRVAAAAYRPTVQLAFIIFAMGTQEFGLDPKRSWEISKLALCIESQLLISKMETFEIQSQALRDKRAVALDGYLDLVGQKHHVDNEFNVQSPLRFELLELNFARELAEMVIRIAARLGRIPSNFDPNKYLELNRDVMQDSYWSDIDSVEFARRHAQMHGIFEGRIWAQ